MFVVVHKDLLSEMLYEASSYESRGWKLSNSIHWIVSRRLNSGNLDATVTVEKSEVISAHNPRPTTSQFQGDGEQTHTSNCRCNLRLRTISADFHFPKYCIFFSNFPDSLVAKLDCPAS